MDYEQMNNNKVFLRGEVLSKPEFSHETYGEAFYEVFLKIPRLSNVYDTIPVTVSEKFLENGKMDIGKTISIKGQFRSYNKIDDGKSRLMLNVFVRDMLDNYDDMNANLIEITGYICKSPIYRTTPFKREICDVLLAVNRAYNKSDYLPCIAWGRNARYMKDAQIGDKVSVVGRIQSREYQKRIDDENSITKIAYEISVGRISLEKSQDTGKDSDVI